MEALVTIFEALMGTAANAQPGGCRNRIVAALVVAGFLAAVTVWWMAG